LKGNEIIVVYSDKQLELFKDDKKTRREAIEYGKVQGITEQELDFLTD